MSDATSALQGARTDGFARIEAAGPVGMITLRADLGAARVAKAVKAVTGCAMPGRRRIVTAGDKAVGWMSSDEVLILLPHAEAPGAVAVLSAALARDHALVAEVSDARALFRIVGAKADQVLMKLCPVDFARMERDELRRTRAAQVAVAIWRSGDDEISLICFRSVAGYVAGILEHSARTGSELLPG